MDPVVHEIKGGDWQSGLCDCSPCGSCVLGTFAPCLRKYCSILVYILCYAVQLLICFVEVVGRTASRLQDASSESPDMCNGDCLIHGGLTLLFGSGWIYTMIKRSDIRDRFGIPGNGLGDCCTAFWCQCCQVIQADNEVKARQAPVVDRSGYQAQTQGMVANLH